MKHCLVFASLISPSKMILFEKKYQTFDTVFHHQMKHLEVRQKYSAARRIFNSLLGVSSGDETLHLMFDILHERSFCIGVQSRSLNFAIFPARVLWTDPTSHERLEISRTPLRLYFVLLTNGTFIPVGLSNSIGCCLFISGATDTFQHFFTNNSSF